MDEKEFSSGAKKAENLENTQGANSDGRGNETHDDGARQNRGDESLTEMRSRAETAEARAEEARKTAERERDLRIEAEKRGHDKGRTPGFGGWLAAVIALGVSTLVLGTMLTFGWLKYNGMQTAMADDAAHSLYELNSVVDNLDGNLAKARVARSAGDRTKIFSDIAIESEMAESALERLPVAGELTQSITGFINKVGESAKNMLATVADGNELSTSQMASIEYMYGCNRQLKQFLNGLTEDCTKEEIVRSLAGKGAMFEGFKGYTDPAAEPPKEIFDGPFAENRQKVSAKDLEGAEKITRERAEQLCLKWFKNMGAESAECTGKAETGQLCVYNVTVSAGEERIFAQVSEAGGKLVMFDSYKECSKCNISAKNCADIAESFLHSLGYDGMECVWSGNSGAVCNLNFVCNSGGVAIYPDMIKVKVCCERGVVTGIEALPYVLNHTERHIDEPELSASQAEALLGGRLKLESTRLALIPKNGGERLAYEFCGTYGGRKYYVYLDADSGTELEVFTVVGNALI